MSFLRRFRKIRAAVFTSDEAKMQNAGDAIAGVSMVWDRL